MTRDEKTSEIPVVEQLGTEFRRAIAARSRKGARRTRAVRRVATVTALLALTAASVAGADALLFADDPADLNQRVEQAGTPASLAPAPGTTVIQQLAEDPDGGAPWGVMVYTSQTGQTCMVHGRTVGGELGTFRPDGAFARYPKEEGGACVDPARFTDASPLALHRSTGIRNLAVPETERTTVWGVAKPGVREVVVHGPGDARTLSVAKYGAFLTVYAGDLAEQARTGDLRVTAVQADGTRADTTLKGPPPIAERQP